LIRAHLRFFNIDREMRTLVIASPSPGEGKTTVARHLAIAAARVGSRVLLVEGDLRKPTLAQQCEVTPGPGLAGVLISTVNLRDATRSVALHDAANGSRANMLDLLPAGDILPPNPGQLLESRAMELLLSQSASTYDLVIIDTPPLAAVSDAFPLLTMVDGVVIVGRIGHTRRDAARQLHHVLTSSGARILGVVANSATILSQDASAYGASSQSVDERSAPAETAAAASKS
jgi:capsular exopolysaccharide synthesis family protein